MKLIEFEDLKADPNLKQDLSARTLDQLRTGMAAYLVRSGFNIHL